jgi:hypothetical protein
VSMTIGIDMVPASDWMYFRSDLLAREDSDVVKVVDAEYAQGLVASREWFANRPATSDNKALEEGVARLLYDQANGLDPGLQIGRLRGVQAGAFLAGVHLRLNIRTVLGRLGGEEFVPTWSEPLRTRLMALRSPLLSAFASALMTPGLSFDDVTGLRQCNLVLVDGVATVRINDNVFPSPAAGQTFLTTYYAWHRETLQTGDAPLWAGDRGQGLQRGWFRQQLGKLALLTGEPFTAFNRRRLPKQWSQRRGISIARIGP